MVLVKMCRVRQEGPERDKEQRGKLVHLQAGIVCPSTERMRLSICGEGLPAAAAGHEAVALSGVEAPQRSPVARRTRGTKKAAAGTILAGSPELDVPAWTACARRACRDAICRAEISSSR